MDASSVPYLWRLMRVPFVSIVWRVGSNGHSYGATCIYRAAMEFGVGAMNTIAITIAI